MSFFRSEPMTLCQMVLHVESAFNCLIVLGYEGKVQFCNVYDGLAIINHQYTAEEKRCRELKQILNYLQNESNQNNIKIVIYPDVDEDEIPEADDLKILEATVQEIYEDLIQTVSNVDALKKKRYQLSERLQVLKTADIVFGTKSLSFQAVMAWSDSIMQIMMQDEFSAVKPEKELHLSFFAGTIPVQRLQSFETMLWRVTRGHFYLERVEYISTPENEARDSNNNFTRKYVFMVFFVGQVLREKIQKICQGFEIKLFKCSESWKERQAEQQALRQEMSDLLDILERTEEHRLHLLLVASADLYIWQIKTNKILMAFFVLNRMSYLTRLPLSKYLRINCWIPTKDIGHVKSALLFGARRTAKGDAHAMFLPMLHEISKRNVEKPTYFVLNKFTQGFQNLIDSYGIAQYQELNPAPYTIITFPFLFAVMFGDVGHGFIMSLFGLWMIVKEKALEEKKRYATEQSEIFDILFVGRYIIALMGAFSIYTGLIYNDCFSKSLNIFGSSWQANFNETTVRGSPWIQLDPSNEEHYIGVPYVMGMDPVWKAAGESAITTFNSLKMKLAIILGVAQMSFGLVLAAVNFIYKKDYVTLLLVLVPQFTFLLCIFAYLTFLIFFKWINFGGHLQAPYNTACAPSILITFINMLMLKGPEEAPPDCEIWMFDTQPYFQIGLLTLAFISIPILLAGKPVFFMLQYYKIDKIKNEALKYNRARTTVRSIRKSLVYNVESTLRMHQSEIFIEPEPERPGFSELWIHSGIHCIESVLGAVSHTASYLRLWALSLAHEQLSSVLWNMVLKIGLTGSRGYWNSLVLCFVFIIWSTLTLAILVVMEGLSAFLHTLRLHWVEFQSKFYEGTGVAFQPFHFAASSPNNIN